MEILSIVGGKTLCDFMAKERHISGDVGAVTSPPSSKTKTSPCSKGDMVPASVVRYGSADEQSQQMNNDKKLRRTSNVHLTSS
jgi:hypothetical protein